MPGALLPYLGYAQNDRPSFEDMAGRRRRVHLDRRQGRPTLPTPSDIRALPDMYRRTRSSRQPLRGEARAGCVCHRHARRRRDPLR